MTELQRITENLTKCVEEMQNNGVQRENVSLSLISQSLISIAEELAILNDNMKKGT